MQPIRHTHTPIHHTHTPIHHTHTNEPHTHQYTTHTHQYTTHNISLSCSFILSHTNTRAGNGWRENGANTTHTQGKTHTLSHTHSPTHTRTHTLSLSHTHAGSRGRGMPPTQHTQHLACPPLHSLTHKHTCR